MSDNLTREQLKHDEVGEALERGVEYVATNWKKLLIGAGVVAAAIVGFASWNQAQAAAADRDAYAVNEAVKLLSASPEEAATGLDQVIADGGDAGRIARLYRATTADADAVALWDGAASGGTDAVSVVARTNQLDALRRAGSFDPALELLDGESGLPEDLRLYQKALTLSAAGRAEETNSVVEELLVDHPGSPWIADARALRAEG